MSEYFLKPKSVGENVKVQLNLSNYANKRRLKKRNRCWYVEILKI